MRYSEAVKGLAPLETFDPAAFLPDSRVPKRVCDFVLALAVAYNDLHDSMLATLLSAQIMPSDTSEPTTELGQASGLRVMLVRVQAGTIHELIELLRKNKNTTADPVFKRLEKQLSKPGKDAWQALLSVAQEKPTASPLAKALLFIRNKVGFHYDPKQISHGYRSCFGPSLPSQPFVSRGATLMGTRFYFADAATGRYMEDQAVDQETKNFLKGHGKLLDDVNQALYELVTRFVAMRNVPWRQHRPNV